MNELVVETTEGPVRGISAQGIASWKGIPFARPPVGPLRFRPPERHERWRGVQEATAFGPAAPQNPSPAMEILGAERLATDEDCLTLNVWSPTADGKPRAVLVWIHGGAFQIGSGSQHWYDGQRLASRGDIVVVTLNYRLGALGFLFLDDAGAPPGSGNLGLLDQIAALEWVRDNIERFGGDLSKVTVFGESAGAMSVATLLGTPRARGLFVQAIAQSGAASHVHSAASAAKLTRAFMDTAGVRSADELSRLSTKDLLAIQGQTVMRPEVMSKAISGQLPFQPVVDGSVLRQAPLDTVAEGGAAGVPLVLGTTQEEMRLFGLMDPGLASLDEAHLLARVRKIVGAADSGDLVAAYRTGREQRGEPTHPAELWQAIATDNVFRVPATRLAEAQLPHAPVWMYRFTWRTPLLGGRLRSCHALDVPFVWGAISDPASKAFVGDGPRVEALSASMQDAWTGFAREGEPRARGLPRWPRYELGSRAHMVFGPDRHVEEDPEPAEREAWAALTSALANEPFAGTA
jgi:para-nitrobenzyl esterase